MSGTDGSHGAMKPRSSCEVCRQRRRRCMVRPGAKRCDLCEAADKECYFGPKYRFQRAETVSYTPHNRVPPHRDQDRAPPRGRVIRHATAPITPSEDETERDPVSHGDSIVDTPPSHAPSDIDDDCSIHTFFPPVGRLGVTPVTSIAYLLDSSPASSHESPIQLTDCAQSRPASLSAQKPLALARLTGREAYLMRIYTLKLAPSVSDIGFLPT